MIRAVIDEGGAPVVATFPGSLLQRSVRSVRSATTPTALTSALSDATRLTKPPGACSGWHLSKRRHERSSLGRAELRVGSGVHQAVELALVGQLDLCHPTCSGIRNAWP